MKETAELPRGVTVFERGWLSANNILFTGETGTALVDSGYCTHAAQTLSLVQGSLGARPLDLLLNTHLHSDHCGGNAALQAAYPALITRIPPGDARQVREWDEVALTYAPTGQQCPRFRIEGTLEPGTRIVLGDVQWDVHAAPGHDPHSVVLFEPASRTLISADALWANGFGVVFPELEGVHAFDEVGATIDLIEQLAPQMVIPGHGGVFSGEAVPVAIARARSRLAAFVANPARHAAHAAKVLLKFKLLELQRARFSTLVDWAEQSSYFPLVAGRYFPGAEFRAWASQCLDELVRGGAAAREGDWVINI